MGKFFKMSDDIVDCEKDCMRYAMRECILLNFCTRFTKEIYSDPEIINKLQWTLNLVEIMFQSLQIEPYKIHKYSKYCLRFYLLDDFHIFSEEDIFKKIFPQDLFPKTIVSHLVDIKDEFDLDTDIFLLVLKVCTTTSLNVYLHIYPCQQITVALYSFVNQYIKNFDKYPLIEKKYPFSKKIYNQIVYAYQHAPLFLACCNKITFHDDNIVPISNDGYQSYQLKKSWKNSPCQPNYSNVTNETLINTNGFLGRGSYGRVDSQIINGKEYAVKTFFDDEDMYVELFRLNKLKHPNILYPIGIGDSCIGYKKMDFSLYQYVNGVKTMSSILIKSYLFQLLLAVEYCHRNNLAHLDIRAPNILLNMNGDLKLADFGISKRFSITSNTKDEVKVSSDYSPPEILIQDYEDIKLTKNLLAIDMWQVGCIFYLMLTNKPLVPTNYTLSESYKKVIELQDNIKEFGWNYLGLEDDLATDLCSKLLDFSSKNRITASNALKHSYLNDSC